MDTTVYLRTGHQVHVMIWELPHSERYRLLLGPLRNATKEPTGLQSHNLVAWHIPGTAP